MEPVLFVIQIGLQHFHVALREFHERKGHSPSHLFNLHLEAQGKFRRPHRWVAGSDPAFELEKARLAGRESAITERFE
ncbi:MAG: hypothetical protein BroJett007_31080 [Chloroflexota bacterium]|nr:MAG: hypothetical protein BroJett007_31080 [Chloroflexota bacterium]